MTEAETAPGELGVVASAGEQKRRSRFFTALGVAHVSAIASWSTRVSVCVLAPTPPGFLYFGWLSGATLKSDFSLLIFVDSAFRRPRAVSGHFPGPPAEEHAQHHLCVFT